MEHKWTFMWALDPHPKGAWVCENCGELVSPPLAGKLERYGPCPNRITPARYDAYVEAKKG